MKRSSSEVVRGGHPRGGLLCIGLLALAACGGSGAPAGAGAPAPAAVLARPLDVYRRLGFLTGPAQFPAVGSLATLAGPGDSTLVLLGLSLPASALRFQRDGDGFVARYLVSLRLGRDSRTAAAVERTETVRVQDFAATGRTDETVLFQAAVPLPPGTYALELRVRDGLSARGFELDDTVEVPAYATATAAGGRSGRAVAAPVPVYQATPRTTRGATPSLILNPRHTAPYGTTPPRVYLEAYGPRRVRLSVRDEGGGVVWQRDVALTPARDTAAGPESAAGPGSEAGRGLASSAVALPLDSLPLGSFWLTAEPALAAEDDGAPMARVPLLVTISDQWLVANFDQLLQFVRYIATPEELDALAAAAPAERRRLWDAFWAARDPLPATPANEFRDEFFERVRVATTQFGEAGEPGWRTDRGEVYIVLGPPSRYSELWIGDERMASAEANAQEWVYDRVPGGGHLSLVFVDREGFGRFRLTPGSESAFRAAARRLRELAERTGGGP